MITAVSALRSFATLHRPNSDQQAAIGIAAEKFKEMIAPKFYGKA
jgi:hypothetical protein